MGVFERDVVIVGGGHNGLACAAYLAKAGLDVLVLEKRDVVGGAAATEEPWPGYRVSSASYVVSLMPPQVVRELDLKRHGYEVSIIARSAPAIIILMAEGAVRPSDART